ncbi:hypothetical protein [Demequina salsinemoris]|uniref:hypothetical protein n=1 Tax=Demequina salsinemoris TaxID=577470 RepID=UPI000783A090|nr:hypothetical protein [Demequina salsinemoris]
MKSQEDAVSTYVELTPHLYRYLDAAHEIQRLAREIDTSELKAEPFVDRFVSEADRLFPHLASEHHREVGQLLEHELRDHRAEIEAMSTGLAPLAIDALDVEWLQGLKDAIDAVTSDSISSWFYLQVWPRVARSRWGSDALLPALLTTAIGDFEVLVARYVRSILTLRPQILSKYERTYTIDEIRRFDDLDDLEAEAIADRAERLMTGGYESWAQWLLERGVDVDGATRNPNPVILEAFQRRHLIVHKGGEVDSSYLRKVPNTALAVGDDAEVTSAYLVDVVDALTTVALKISAASMKHFTKGSPPQIGSVFDFIVSQSTYTLLSNRQFEVVANFEEWAAPLRHDQLSRQIATVNAWLARKRMGEFAAVQHDVESWDTDDLDPKFTLAKLILTDKIAEAHALARNLAEAGALAEQEFLKWPLLEEVRDHDSLIQEASLRITWHDH